MTVAPVLLLVDVPESATPLLQAALGRARGARALSVSGSGPALARARAERPDLVVVGPGLAWEAAAGLVRELRADPGMAGVVTLALLGGGSVPLEAALEAGFDEVLPEPHDPALVLRRARALLEDRRLRATLRVQAAELERLRALERDALDRLVGLVVDVLDRREPGAAERLRRLADLARRIAERFDVPGPMRRDLALAVRLADLGRLAVPAARAAHDPAGADMWSGASVTANLLARVPGLEGAAELVAGIGENWDGTGLPGHLLQGQIPLRSRILRVLRDYSAALERDGHDVERALRHLVERAGTLYDPMVVVELQSVLDDLPGRRVHPDRRLVYVPDLEAGMVLAEDLYADTGVKLLARDAPITPANLDFILRRHRVEPILHAAVVKRAA
jgi:response regulator RpfG family c-di-GMP phosphodiesterase